MYTHVVSLLRRQTAVWWLLCAVVRRRCRARHGCDVGRERLQNANDLLPVNGF